MNEEIDKALAALADLKKTPILTRIRMHSRDVARLAKTLPSDGSMRRLRKVTR